MKYQPQAFYKAVSLKTHAVLTQTSHHKEHIILYILQMFSI